MQFDVYPNPSPRMRDVYHYVVDVVAGVALFGVLAWGTPRLMAWWEPVTSK